ncbi:MAG TPA: magnesium-translocating P-type ATPase [Fluviicoccus sp.]|nr:magnesium-translocating P-type ATPase [Fluviicoccus sp.]
MSDSPKPYWSDSADTLMQGLGVTMAGLSSEQAAARLKEHGLNAVEDRDETTLLKLLIHQFASPLVLILVFGAIVSLVLKEWTEAAIILAVVLGSTILGTVQEYRAANAVAALRQRLALTVKVHRDGSVQTREVAALVPGDIIELSAGNLVPADGVLLTSTDFLVTEASLTGEPFPVEKQPGVVDADTPLAGRRNCVFLGTSVRSGTATILVTETGRHTTMGALASRLHLRPPESEFERGLRNFGNLLLKVMLLTVIFVLVVNQLLGRPVIESLLFAVALAVGLSPELLPAIVSVTMSHGAREMARCGVIVRRLEAIENLGSMNILCTDKTGTLTAGVVELSDATDCAGEASANVRMLAFLNASLETGIDNPLDAALVRAGTVAGLVLPIVEKVDEIPYDFLRKRLTIVVEDGLENGEPYHRIVTKGAFANMLAVCTSMRTKNGIEPLDPPSLQVLDYFFRKKSEQGFRVLALATRRVAAKTAYSHDDEQGMTLEGFLLFLDPPKPEAKQTLEELKALGISIRIITGDNRHVAAHVAAAVGLDADSLITGEEIDRLSDEALWQRADQTILFAEVDPQQKERIVRALKHVGHAVGYLGDGINDAPALHAADVGISVDSAVDVARDTADIVLLRPDLEVLRQGVLAGRHAFANTLKYIKITVSANFGNMLSMVVAAPFLPFLPLLAKQILLNNFLSDLPSMAVSTDRVDPEHTQTAQRWNVKEVRHFMVVFGLVSSAFDLLTFVVLLRVFQADETTFRTVWFLVSLLTELAVVLVLRTMKPCWRSRPSPLLLWTTVAVAAGTFLLPYIPWMAKPFGFTPLPVPLLLASVLIVAAYISCTEWVKRRLFA